MGVKEEFFRLKEACIKSKGADKEKAEREMQAFLTQYVRKMKQNFKLLLRRTLPEYIRILRI